jgi:hypothetical protein
MIRRGIGVQSFVSAGGGTDADAQAFITAAGITDATQQSAINTLVTDLKGYGIWIKMKAIWPFCGGTSSTHKWNLKDPRDLDAAFRLVFSGGATHSSTGYLPNGTNGYADTKFIPSTNLNLNNTHMSFYSRTNTNNGIDDFSSIISGDTANMRMIIRELGAYKADMYTSAQRTTGSIADSRGFFVLRRTSSTSLKFDRNAVNLSTNTNANTGTLPTLQPFIGAAYRVGTPPSIVNYSNRECAFASIGDGLTETEAANLYTAVQAYQTSLSRNV